MVESPETAVTASSTLFSWPPAHLVPARHGLLADDRLLVAVLGGKYINGSQVLVPPSFAYLPIIERWSTLMTAAGGQGGLRSVSVIGCFSTTNKPG